MIAYKRCTNDIVFKLYDKKIEIVKYFCYLGIEINNKGTLSNAVDRLHSKAFKAHMSLRETFNFFNGASVGVMVKLYESMVQSIYIWV